MTSYHSQFSASAPSSVAPASAESAPAPATAPSSSAPPNLHPCFSEKVTFIPHMHFNESSLTFCY